MQYTKQIKITILVVFLIFLSAVNAFAFVHVAGSWGHTDPSRRDRVYVTQGTNGEILSLSGFVYFYYGYNMYAKSTNWYCNNPGEPFVWNLRITERYDYNIYQSGTYPISCNVEFSADNASAATYALDGPADYNGVGIGQFSQTGGTLQRLTVVSLIENGPPPEEQPDVPPLPFAFMGAGGSAGSGGKNPIGGNPPREPEDCPREQGQLPTTLPGNPGAMSVVDPVNIVSGNFFLSETDLQLKSRLPLKLIRSYNSIDKSVTAFGRGWSAPFTVSLTISESSIVFRNSDGARLVFEKDGENYITPEGHDVNISHITDAGLWCVAIPKGSEWYFDENGQIVRMVQACCGAGASDAIVFEYDSDGNLTKVINPAGQWMQFVSTDGLITSVLDSSGRSASYEYSANKHLMKFTDPVGRITTYSYDADGFMTQAVKPGNRITSLEYTNDRVTKITNPDQTINTLTWNETTRQMTLNDNMGVDHLYSFDEDWHLASYSVSAVGLTQTLSFSGETVSSLVDSLGYTSSYQYGEDGYISGITDKAGFNTAYTWHPTLKKLTGKTDSLGRTWSYEWCARGNLISKTDPAGNVTSYTYDSHNNRTSATDPLGHVTRYIYDSTGNNLIATIDTMGGVSSFTYDLRGNLTSSADQIGRTTSYEYDIIDRLVKSTYPDGRFTSITYDNAGHIASRIDNLGRVTAYTYDYNGKLLTTTRPDGTVLAHAYDAAGRKMSSTDALGRVTAYEYDALDNMVKVIYPDQTYQTYVYDTEKRLTSSTDELGNVTAYEYDPMGRMLASIDPAGARYENTYDAAGRKIAAKDPLGRITAYEHDLLDRIVKTTAPDSTTNTSSYDAVGNLVVSTNALNQQTVYEYDALNRQVKTTRPNGAQFTTSYDAAGQVIGETDALGNVTANAYDNAGRRISTTNALNHTWLYNYDNAGRLVKTTDPLGGVATMTYDIMDRVIYECDALGRVNAYEYDLTGKRIAQTDAIGRRSIFSYDFRDRLTTEVDGEGRIVSYGYDSAGRKTSLTDGAGRIWRWTYDSLGRVTAETDPLGNQVKSSYDAVGNLTLKTNARAQATAYEYDLMNRLVKANYPDSTTATFSYDALGREVIRSGAAETVEKAYDVAGNLISERFVNQNKGWSYSFDLMGNRVQAVSPENETFKYKYDNLYRLIELETGKSSEKIAYSYDALGRNIEEKRVDSTTANTFDAAGQLLEMKHFKLVLDKKAGSCWNKGKKGKKKEPTYKEEILALRQYSYDLAGNRISMTDENGKVTAYYYDSSNWLTQVVYPNNDVVTYAYNDAGDRISEKLNDESVVDYSYDSAGRMLSKGDEAFAYDADGNMLSDAETSYTWNSDNRLIKVEKTIGGCKHDKFRKGHGFGHLKHGKEAVVYEEYTYLPMDWRRVTRKAGKYSIKTDRKGNATKDDESEQTFVSIYDGEDESHEYLLTEAKFKFHGKCKPRKADLKLFREFVGGPAVDDIEHTRYNRLSLAMLKDGLGSTIALTGINGKTIARIGYDAWGEFLWDGKDNHAPCKEDDFDGYLDRLENTRGFGRGKHNGWAFGRHFGSKLTPYLYTGRRFSSFTSQYFNRNRYYSPALGRFTQKDPIGFNGGNNLYRYADNNPGLFIDPFGLKKVLQWLYLVETELSTKFYSVSVHSDPIVALYAGTSLYASASALRQIGYEQSSKSTKKIDYVGLEIWEYKIFDDTNPCDFETGVGPHNASYLYSSTEYREYKFINIFGSSPYRKYNHKRDSTVKRHTPFDQTWVDKKVQILLRVCRAFEESLLQQ